MKIISKVDGTEASVILCTEKDRLWARGESIEISFSDNGNQSSGVALTPAMLTCLREVLDEYSR